MVTIDRQTDGQTDRQTDYFTPAHACGVNIWNRARAEQSRLDQTNALNHGMDQTVKGVVVVIV